MRSTMQVIAGVATTAMFLAGQGVQAQIYPLPQDPTEPVITLDYQGDRLRRIDPAPDFDFKSTMMHELLHAVGFSNSVTQLGADACGQAEPTAGGWVPYDQHLGNTTANFINASTFVINTTNWNTALTGGTGPTNGVLWHGANGTAANSGNPVPLYSPTTFSLGSSVAHLDDDFFTSSALLMEAATGPGLGTRTLDSREVGIMKDIGFTNAVPVELQSFEID